MITEKLILFLNEKAEQYNQPFFISADPISIPHLFSSKQDIEIAAFFAAVFAWGNRTAIIKKTKELFTLMDHAPYAFITGHSEQDLKAFLHFKHRTFNATDLLYFIWFLHNHYQKYSSLEDAFIPTHPSATPSIEERLVHFHNYFFSLAEAPDRTKKHIATPARNSACKRLNMFLRWMVRKDNNGVDFGIWQRIEQRDLICPLDLHVARVARGLQLLQRKQNDWQAALELTKILRTLDPSDPVKYDFALFGIGIMENYQ